MEGKKKIRYGIIGGGFRAEFYLRAAWELPELFEVCGVVTHYPERNLKLFNLLGLKNYPSAEALVEAGQPEFLVVSTMREPGIPDPMDELVKLDIPILLETPAARTMEGLLHIYETCRGKKVQVAEQLHAQPETAARIAIAHSGILGEVTQVELDFQHTYHCMDVLRRFFKLGFENAQIWAKNFHFPAIEGYARTGVAEKEKLLNEKRQFALLDFGGKLGIYDYADSQVRSYVRSEHIAVRGERGEISDQTVRWLVTNKDFRSYTYERLYAGNKTNLEGFFFRGLMGAGDWLYKNPYPHTFMADEDIAIATILEETARYVREGVSFCSIADACQDQYLSLMIEKSAQEGKPVLTETQIWAKE
ncbi:MAG: Gfo/Idh/MocA family oxidoreductase [Treponema sp.]|jgi:predicted dehydrogenase|nr:Gfo/Idh/MocA family oxidoreductase [Treponema sp.]